MLVGIMLTVLAVTGSQKTSSNGKGEVMPSVNGQSTEITNQQYTLAQIQAHNAASDCWTTIDGGVYNISKFVTGGMHPGGSRILLACGVDATDLFTGKSPMGRMHSSMARMMLNQYKLGVLE